MGHQQHEVHEAGGRPASFVHKWVTGGTKCTKFWGVQVSGLPEPPRPFGSYPPGDVTFLLTDLSDRALETGLEEREAHLRSGGHYSEYLPIEYEPTAEYLAMFEDALARGARRTALGAAVAAERVVALRGRDVVLVSLARAGTPVGILMRRYLRAAHDLDLPHYSVSIIRDRGLDPVAVRWMQERHPDVALQFVDGWTGKGAIQRELDAAAAQAGLDPRLAVVTDPGWCAALPGSRDDFLIPSACLNSTVSGLVSRTVLRDDLIGPDDFHGAKEYAELAPRDVSNRFVDTVHACVDDDLVAEARDLAAEPIAPPSWSGWAAVLAIGERFGIADVNRIKPGVGESTRVLLRRKPDRLLVRDDGPDVAHLLQLAAERDVPVERFADMPYSSCGLISAD